MAPRQKQQHGKLVQILQNYPQRHKENPDQEPRHPRELNHALYGLVQQDFEVL
eukprot:CAMPEP_0206320160 /NCGR_PEP_ID=MMETSP0106_2-20121207/18166_1 /ASSEMBLY_ACC=CAM_ASM_000206 /TAXON_ID=81532 /ORGANISM="Acanthoeca-like sp., Strain 10tr" /LENGTH=52 /DNA_ID=CAMNT_0053752091 /DNA_START=88 /DNA_END=243 /DNA_ORIENTATION=+